MQIRPVSFIAVASLLTLLAVPAAAQTTPGSGEDSLDPAVGVEYGFLHFGPFNSWSGVDVNYHTKQLTQPATGAGIRVGIAGEIGFHHFSVEDDFFGDAQAGYMFTSFTGGLHLTADKIGSPRFQPYGNLMFGLGRFSGEGGSTDTLMLLMPGADIPLNGQKFKIRVEVGQVWDFFDGGHDVAWRYTFGVAIPLK